VQASWPARPGGVSQAVRTLIRGPGGSREKARNEKASKPLKTNKTAKY
jgi:hypothetical protein